MSRYGNERAWSGKMTKTARFVCAAAMLGCVHGMFLPSAQAGTEMTNLQRARVYLGAGDFRRAIEACRREVDTRPSAESYLYLTYVYQALDAYVESLAQGDKWVPLELLYLSLVTGKTEDLVDPPDVLARIAKEMMQSGARQQSDIAAAMATTLDPAVVSVLWPQQTSWRKANPGGWWRGIPPEWTW